MNKNELTYEMRFANFQENGCGKMIFSSETGAWRKNNVLDSKDITGAPEVSVPTGNKLSFDN